ncbi:hypothetical protein SMD44_00694 [Streptomyces alboflavus]|uniref:Uncharacterized protein n=1 Tax=Streptomyces alboflavus TaxID=67267 RepID=A0A1Z1W4E3_9ACTN|nr:hypothetical protein SMD44_00694 [Streptomyces alboflavus]
MAAGTTRLLSAAADGGQADGPSGRPVVSADGRVVAFMSQATNLVAGDTNDRSDLFVRDLRGGELRRVVDPHGEISSPTLSANGRYVAYTVRDDEGTAVFVRDLWKGGTERADVDLPMQHIDAHAPTVSADGRTVAFAVLGTDSTRTGAQAVYVRDLRAQRTELVSFPAEQDETFLGFRAPTLSADGQRVAYQYTHGTRRAATGPTSTSTTVAPVARPRSTPPRRQPRRRRGRQPAVQRRRIHPRLRLQRLEPGPRPRPEQQPQPLRVRPAHRHPQAGRRGAARTRRRALRGRGVR